MRSREGGFLLMEAILAAAVLAVGVVALLRGASAAVRLGTESADLYKGALLVEDRAWVLEKAPESISPTTAEDATLGEMSWGVDDASSGAEGVAGRRVTASWFRGGRRRDMSLTVLRPST